MASLGGRPPTSGLFDRPGQAKSFALGPDEAHIMRALGTRFGLTAEEASDHLQIMKRDRRTPLEDHANEVEHPGCFRSRHWRL